MKQGIENQDASTFERIMKHYFGDQNCPQMTKYGTTSSFDHTYSARVIQLGSFSEISRSGETDVKT